MVNKKYNKDLDKRLNDIFIFTKDNNDKVEYNEILELLDNDYINREVLSYNLKNNYCSTYFNVVSYYTGLKIKTNKTSDMKEYMRLYMRLYYQKKKEENPEKVREYERIKKAKYRARLRGMDIFIDTDPSIFLIKCFRNNP